jgi:CRP-like cAMP-binding protein
MPRDALSRQTSNRILADLSQSDFDLLEPDLQVLELPVRKRLEIRHRPIDYVYFIESGLASVVANGMGERSVEAGIVGREGVTGLAVIMGTDRSPLETFMQFGGSGQRLAAAKLKACMEASVTLRRTLLNYGHAFYIQTAYTVLANARSKLEDRLSRWLLMAHDRVDGDKLTLTHEFLAIMLGVRRPGVTIALKFLEVRGLIQTSRGVISIVDRKGLEESANGAYGTAEAELQRLSA